MCTLGFPRHCITSSSSSLYSHPRISHLNNISTLSITHSITTSSSSLSITA
jgi:hypothetical protein